MSKRNGKTTALSVIIKILCIFTIIYIAVMLVFNVSTGDFEEIFEKGEQRVVKEVTLTANEVNSIDLDWTSGNVEIFPSTDNTLRIVESSNRDLDENEKFQYTLENGRLNIEHGDWNFKFSFLVFGSQSTSLKISLPSKQYEELKLKITSGRMSVEDINTKTADFSMTSGKIEVSRVTAAEMSLKLSSGRMEVENSTASNLVTNQTSGTLVAEGKFDEIKTQLTSGKLELETSVLPRETSIKLTSGKAELKLPENNGFTLDYKKTSGSIKSDFISIGKDVKKGSVNYKSGGPQIHVDITSGSVSIEKD